MSYKTICWQLVVGSTLFWTTCAISYTETRHIFAERLLETFGNGSSISLDDISRIYTKHLLQWPTKSTLSACFVEENERSTVDNSCLLEKCLSPADVYKLSGLTEQTGSLEVSTLSMILFYTLENETCVSEQAPIALAHVHHESSDDEDHEHDHEPVTRAETWGYGVLCTSVIVLAALGGLLALPFVHGANYKRLLTYMVGLAVGTLSGSSLLFLMPEALELHEEDLDEHNPLWKSLVMLGAIYVFYIVERVLKMITSWRERHKHHKELHHEIRGGRFAKLKPETRYRDQRFTDISVLPRVPPCGDHVSQDSGIDNTADLPTDAQHAQFEIKDAGNNASQANINEADKDLLHIAPVAWMIIFGDALHNFVDGVSIGAAFTDSVLGGVSVSVAVLCEELPHELGDFAVLLNAGMTTKRAAFFNFLSACTIYIGLVVGIFLGENMEANSWVFAFAGGMFLYIALVDMMPEMCAAGELEENKKLIGPGVIFFLQSLGILSGFGIMLVLAIYGGSLHTAITGEA